MKSLFLFSLLLVGVFCDFDDGLTTERCKTDFACGDGFYCEILCELLDGPCYSYCINKMCSQASQIYRCKNEDNNSCQCVCKDGYTSVDGRCVEKTEKLLGAAPLQ